MIVQLKPTPADSDRAIDAIGRTPTWFSFVHREHRKGNDKPNVEYSVAFELDGERFTYVHHDIDEIVERITKRSLTHYEQRDRCYLEVEEYLRS